MPRIIFGMPIMQLIVLSFAATFEIKNTDIIFVDDSHSIESAHLISKFEGSAWYTVKATVRNYNEAADMLRKNQAHQILIIPRDFSEDIARGNKASLQIVTDAVDGSAAALRNGYAQAIISGYQKDIIVQKTGLDHFKQPIETSTLFWFNPELNYQTFMVPGILVLLISMMGMFLAGMNIVKEKEIGTIEQINVSPIKKSQFIIGKLLPFWLIAMFELAFGLVLAKLIFNIPMLGSVGLLFLVAGVYMVLILAIGLIISTVSDTQQQAMFIAWFFMVIFILLSGLFTPVESMPEWAQRINYLNPIAWFIKIIRLLMLKGAGFAEIKQIFFILLVYGSLMMTIAVKRYKKRV
jgi:ABC-2 type transport system permease protein